MRACGPGVGRKRRSGQRSKEPCARAFHVAVHERRVSCTRQAGRVPYEVYPGPIRNVFPSAQGDPLCTTFRATRSRFLRPCAFHMDMNETQRSSAYFLRPARFRLLRDEAFRGASRERCFPCCVPVTRFEFGVQSERVLAAKSNPNGCPPTSSNKAAASDEDALAKVDALGSVVRGLI